MIQLFKYNCKGSISLFCVVVTQEKQKNKRFTPRELTCSKKSEACLAEFQHFKKMDPYQLKNTRPIGNSICGKPQAWLSRSPVPFLSHSPRQMGSKCFPRVITAILLPQDRDAIALLLETHPARYSKALFGCTELLGQAEQALLCHEGLLSQPGGISSRQKPTESPHLSSIILTCNICPFHFAGNANVLRAINSCCNMLLDTAYRPVSKCKM